MDQIHAAHLQCVTFNHAHTHIYIHIITPEAVEWACRSQWPKTKPHTPGCMSPSWCSPSHFISLLRVTVTSTSPLTHQQQEITHFSAVTCDQMRLQVVMWLTVWCQRPGGWERERERGMADLSNRAALREQPVFLLQQPTSAAQAATLDIPTATQLKRDICSPPAALPP